MSFQTLDSTRKLVIHEDYFVTPVMHSEEVELWSRPESISDHYNTKCTTDYSNQIMKNDVKQQPFMGPLFLISEL